MRNRNYFKLPNDIFDKHLSAGELKVLAALYSLKSHVIYNGMKYVKIKQSNIARICGFSSTRTISSAVNKLCLHGYIQRIDRYFVDLHKLGTNVYTIPTVKTKYFFVSKYIFRYSLSVSQFRMYLYLCKCAVSRTRHCWNSYNDICQALGLKRSAVIKTIRELNAAGIIKKYTVKKRSGSFSDNHYKIVTLKFNYKFRQKKKRHRILCFARKADVFSYSDCFYRDKLPFSFNIGHKKRFVKRKRLKHHIFFALRGSPK